MTSTISTGTMIDPTAFDAYIQLRSIAEKYNAEDKLAVPQLVIVGETSTGKSMLVQNFLRFPCSFSQANVATRCPVAYRLIYNPDLADDRVHVKRPADIEANQLGDYLRQLMEQIEQTGSGFSEKPELIEIESGNYSDFEIIDVPGFVSGERNVEYRKAVEAIVEQFVRDPRFSIVLLKETTQIGANWTAAERVHHLCTTSTPIKSTFPPRPDYHHHMITIQTKFDAFMLHNTTALDANTMIAQQLKEFGESYFVNMIFGGYSMTTKSFDENVAYIANLPRLEREQVENWVNKINQSTASSTHQQRFNPEYRERIGIDVVRKKIQGLWLRAFREALPKLKTAIEEQLTVAREKYDRAQAEFKLLNPRALKENYLRYIEEFRKTIRQYTAYTSEIDFYFPVHLCGKTYSETEQDFVNKWKRYQTITWRAYLPVNELTRQQLNEHTQLNLRLVGARHFSRLQQVFSLMILSFKTRDLTRDEIETTESLLYGGLNDYENLEKSLRELVRSLIRETFLMGIAWLTQMHAYILDTFHINVRKFLLSNEKFPYLRGHSKFLNLVDLEYHTIVRELIRDAVRFIRDSRNSWTSYVHYDITSRMRKLALSIPVEIDNTKYEKTMIPDLFVRSPGSSAHQPATLLDVFKHISPQQLLDHIYGSESFLTQTRDPQTGNHHTNGRKAILELYTATCGRLLQDITSSFYTCVVTKMQSFDSLPNQRALSTRIDRMSEKQIGTMANIRVQDIRDSAHRAERMIDDLSIALTLVDAAIKEMSSGNRLTDYERQQLKESAHQQAALRQKDKEASTHDTDRPSSQVLTRSYSETLSPSLGIQEGTNDEQHLMTIDDPLRAAACLLDLYKKHDQEDLTYGFLEGDSFEQDKAHPRAHDHIFVDPDTMDFDQLLPSQVLKGQRSPMTNGYLPPQQPAPPPIPPRPAVQENELDDLDDCIFDKHQPTTSTQSPDYKLSPQPTPSATTDKPPRRRLFRR